MKNLCERKDFFSRSEQVKVNIKVTYNIFTKDAAVHKPKGQTYKLLQHPDKIQWLHSLKTYKITMCHSSVAYRQTKGYEKQIPQTAAPWK